ncbi:MAG TPA: hypothetical protein VNO84_06710 [Burkholderiaceae bacterium]|nr:hypothetical protein [Burkholderiaceae bacterium]
MWGEITGWLVAFNYPAGDTPPRWIEVHEAERDTAVQKARAWAAQHLPEAVVCKVVPVLDF